MFALLRFHHDSLTGVPSLKAHVKPMEKMFCRRGKGGTGMSSVPEHASRMRGKRLPCWCLSDMVQVNAWRDHAPNLCQTYLGMLFHTKDQRVSQESWIRNHSVNARCLFPSGAMSLTLLLPPPLCLSQRIPSLLFRSFFLQVSPSLSLRVPRSPALCLTRSMHLHLTLPLVLSAS